MIKKSIASCLGLVLASSGCSTDDSTLQVRTTQQASRVQQDCSESSASPLVNAACAAHKLIGSAADAAPISSSPEYADALTREYRYVTPENSMKWSSLQPVDSDTWDFTQADALVGFAQANNQQVKGHTLVWHQQLPSFVTPDMKPKELRKLVKKHIKKVVKHYRDDIRAWDVVNEAVADDGSLRESIFLQLLGPDYIEDAFITAAKATSKKNDSERDPDVKLLYNDYGILTVNAKSDGVYAMLRSLVRHDVPIDGIGFQGHIDARFAPTTEDIVANFKRFSKLGLTLNISELDVRVAGVPGTQGEKLALQQQIYHRIASACAQVKACEALTVWGVGDGYSWIDGQFGADDPLLLDDNFAIKPAYRGVVDGLRGLVPDAAGAAPNLASSGSFETDAAGWFGFGSPSVALQAGGNTGAQSLIGGGRTATWQGPALSLTDLVQPGFEYSASAFVRLAGTRSSEVQLSLKTNCAGEESYTTINSLTANKNGFTQTSGSFAIPYCDLSEATLYFQGPEAGVDIVVDDVVVRQTAEPLGVELLADGGFESGVDGWFGFGPPIVSQTSESKSGVAALLTSGRTDSWQGPATSLTALVEKGATYRVSAFAKLGGEAAASELHLTLKLTCDGTDSYSPVATATAENGVWTELAGSYQVPLCSNLSELTLYVEGSEAGVDIILDDVSVAQRLSVPVLQPPADPNIVANGDFEIGTDGWYTWSGEMALSTDHAHSGNQSLVVSGSSLGLAATDLASVMEPGGTYQLSYWVTIEGADSAELHVTRAMDCGEGAAYSWVSDQQTVVPGEWTELKGVFTVPIGCTMDQLTMFVEGGNVTSAGETVSLFVDSVVVVPPANLVPNGDFESDSSGWYSWGGTTVTTSNLYAHSGNKSLVASGAVLGPAASDFATVLEAGQSYSLSYWVLLDGAESATAHVTRAMDCGSGTDYSWVSSNETLTAGVWTQLSGAFSVPTGCDMTKLQLYVEGGDLIGAEASVQLYVDDVAVSQ